MTWMILGYPFYETSIHIYDILLFKASHFRSFFNTGYNCLWFSFAPSLGPLEVLMRGVHAGMTRILLVSQRHQTRHHSRLQGFTIAGNVPDLGCITLVGYSSPGFWSSEVMFDICQWAIRNSSGHSLFFFTLMMATCISAPRVDRLQLIPTGKL